MTAASSSKPTRSSGAAHTAKKRPAARDVEDDDDQQALDAGMGYFEAKTEKVTKQNFSKLMQQAQPYANDYKAIFRERVLDEHAEELAERRAAWRDQYDMWHAELKVKFNLLFYGAGSKRAVLNDFADGQLTDGALVKINAFLGQVTARAVVVAAAAALSGKPESALRPMAPDSLIADIGTKHASSHVYVVIHSLDAPCMRSAAEQQLLSQLAACTNVHIAASVDHVNCGALFDARQRIAFAWLWHHVPTLEPFYVETMGFAPVLADASAHETQQSAAVVLSMLTPSSQSVFKTFAEALLAEQLNDDDPIEGITYEHLFRLARERFLVSADANLRQHITEFKDHDLLKTRRGEGGVELLYVPLPAQELAALVAQLSEPREQD